MTNDKTTTRITWGNEKQRWNLTTKRLQKLVHFKQYGLVPRSRVRIWPFTVIIVLVLLVLGGRLTQLTVVEGAYQWQQAESNRVLAIRTTASRGIFFDRNGKQLVHNNPAYKRQVPGTAIAQARFEDISREQALELQYQNGERVFFDIVRQYPCGRACAPILGYMGEITGEELKTGGSQYVMGDRLGKTGLEKAWESDLRGQAGSELVEVNAQGKVQRVIGKIDHRNGQDVTLTIDYGLQQTLYDALKDYEGAAVAQVPQTGEILAFVSTPAFDPNDVKTSLTETGKPFFNRVIGGMYPPGSVFKVVTAVAGLEEGKLDAGTVFDDTGEIRIGTYRFGNWLYDQHGRTEGAIDVVKGLQRSNDIFFYKAGEAVGAETLAEWARLLGYGQPSGVSIPGEVAGLIPHPQWKEKYKGERWFLGNTYHMAIGQGDVLVTPLQVNRMLAAIAANGILCPPVLNKQDIGRVGCQQLNLSEETIRLVREGLTKACQPGGTGTALFNFSPQVGCKTGTAQEGGEKDNPHAWFTVMAPVENPQIVLTVLVEHGGQGSEVASPIARKALDYWFAH